MLAVRIVTMVCDHQALERGLGYITLLSYNIISLLKNIQKTACLEASLRLRGQYWLLEISFYHEFDLGL